MIKVKVTVKNDQKKLCEDFECIELTLDPKVEPLKAWIDQVIKSFVDPVEDVIVTTRMEV